MEKMGPSSPKSGKMRSDLIKDHKESQGVEASKTLGYRFASKYSGIVYYFHLYIHGGDKMTPKIAASFEIINLMSF
jgi:hypothetical protein